MEVPREALLLRIFTGADDSYGVEEPLYVAIVMKAREMHLAGATVLKGPIGYGQAGCINRICLPLMIVQSSSRSVMRRKRSMRFCPYWTR